MSPPYVLALDQGTSSARAILFDRHTRPVAIGQRSVYQTYPRPGWVEQDPDALWAAQWGAVTDCLAQTTVAPQEIAALGITNQRETLVVWNRATGRPVYPAISWQCRRSVAIGERLLAQGAGPIFREKTGLPLDAYFSGTKLLWLWEHVPGLREQAQHGELQFGTVDSWLIYQLTQGRVHATDASNAARTLLFNLQTQDWDDDLLSLLQVPRSLCPTVVDSSGVAGYTDRRWFGREIPIAGIAGDQQAALFGQGCSLGMAKTTYGTGSFVLMPTGSEPILSAHGLLTTVAWRIAGQVEYALEGAILITGGVIQWLREACAIFDRVEDSESLARSVPDNQGVYFVPALVGLGAPYWDSTARGTIVGLSPTTGRPHLVRAALEAIAYQTRDVLEAMIQDGGPPIASLRVDGGAITNQFLAQFQADILGCRVERPGVTEMTARGAACLAGLAVGLWPDRSAVEALWPPGEVFEPTLPAQDREFYYAQWKRAVRRAQHWVESADAAD